MNNNLMLTVCLPIAIIILSIVLNFHETLSGSPATTLNFLVTFAYIAVWIVIVTVCFKGKNSRAMVYYTVFWVLTTITALITVYVNMTEDAVSWAIPFVALFLTPFYGIHFFVDDYLITSSMIVIISFVMVVATITLGKKINKS